MTSDYIPQALDRAVRERAGDRCEYCRLAQAGQEATFHVDHVHPRRLGGATTIENLALACVSCSLRKGGAIEAVDPETDQTTSLFNPRSQSWSDHFASHDDGRIVARTASGRATEARLRFNRVVAVAIRREEMLRGRYS
jgi:HNH endonuclease